MKNIMFLCILSALLCNGCSTIPEVLKDGYESYKENADRKAEEKRLAAERAEAEKVAAQKAEEERIAKEKEAKEARRKAAEPGPHPAERRVATQKAGDDYYARGEKPDILIVQNPLWKRTLWKPQNDGLNGIVMLLDTEFSADYAAGNMSSIVISADPYGNEVINGVSGNRTVSGVGKICPPYSDGRSCMRWDGLLGQAWRPGPVFVVLKMKDGRRTTWMLADPGVRTQR